MAERTERTACGVYAKCEWCTKKNRCNWRGYSTDTGKKEEYFPDLWEIFHEEEKVEEKWSEHLTEGWWRY